MVLRLYAEMRLYSGGRQECTVRLTTPRVWLNAAFPIPKIGIWNNWGVRLHRWTAAWEIRVNSDPESMRTLTRCWDPDAVEITAWAVASSTVCRGEINFWLVTDEKITAVWQLRNCQSWDTDEWKVTGAPSGQSSVVSSEGKNNNLSRLAPLIIEWWSSLHSLQRRLDRQLANLWSPRQLRHSWYNTTHSHHLSTFIASNLEHPTMKWCPSQQAQ